MLGPASGVKDTGQLHSCEAWEGRSVGRLAYYGNAFAHTLYVIDAPSGAQVLSAEKMAAP